MRVNGLCIQVSQVLNGRQISQKDGAKTGEEYSKGTKYSCAASSETKKVTKNRKSTFSSCRLSLNLQPPKRSHHICSYGITPCSISYLPQRTRIATSTIDTCLDPAWQKLSHCQSCSGSSKVTGNLHSVCMCCDANQVPTIVTQYKGLSDNKNGPCGPWTSPSQGQH